MFVRTAATKSYTLSAATDESLNRREPLQRKSKSVDGVAGVTSQLSNTGLNEEKKTSDENDDEGQPPPPPPYTLREHCQHLKLRTETTKTHTYWYCDYTDHFCKAQQQMSSTSNANPASSSLKDVVVEYLQPFLNLYELQDMYVGTGITTTLAPNFTYDPVPVRTLIIRLRPDTRQQTILESVKEAFQSIHPKYSHVLQETVDDGIFIGIGADGEIPYVVTATIGTKKYNEIDKSKSTFLQRHLLLRFYHLTQFPGHILNEDVLTKLEGIYKQKSPLGVKHTPINQRLKEASLLAYCIIKHDLKPWDVCSTREEMTEWLFANYATSKDKHKTFPSITSFNEQRMNNNGGGGSSGNVNVCNGGSHHTLFPSLSPPSSSTTSSSTTSTSDYQILQESYLLVERIYSELELKYCTYNTLALQSSSRFGMRPNQSTIDKLYCYQLYQISQLQMLEELSTNLETTDNVIHTTLQEYTMVEKYLINEVLRKKYNIPYNDQRMIKLDEEDNSRNACGKPLLSYYNDQGEHQNLQQQNGRRSSTTSHSDKRITLPPPRQLDDYPWNDEVKLALEDISNSIAANCFCEFHPKTSMDMANDSVLHLFTSFSIANDIDCKSFLKKRNQQNMIRLKEQQDSLRNVLKDVILTPTIWCKPGGPIGSPTLYHTITKWNDIVVEAKTSNLRRNPVPIIEFVTKLGIGCITGQQLILQTNGIFNIHTYVYDYIDIDVSYTPNHPLTTISIYDVSTENGKVGGSGSGSDNTNNGKPKSRIGGFNPITTKYDEVTMDAEWLVKFIHIIKSVQTD